MLISGTAAVQYLFSHTWTHPLRPSFFLSLSLSASSYPFQDFCLFVILAFIFFLLPYVSFSYNVQNNNLGSVTEKRAVFMQR